MAFLQISSRRGIFYFWPLDWNQTVRVAREEENDRDRTASEPGGGGAIAGAAALTVFGLQSTVLN